MRVGPIFRRLVGLWHETKVNVVRTARDARLRVLQRVDVHIFSEVRIPTRALACAGHRVQLSCRLSKNWALDGLAVQRYFRASGGSAGVARLAGYDTC